MWLLCGSDDNYARPLAVTLSSALNTIESDHRVSLVVVDGGMRPSSRSRLEKVVFHSHRNTQLQWARATDLDLTRLKGARHITASTYLRLFVDELLPDDAERVIYLDSDLLVRGSLVTLFATDLAGKAIGAVRDMVIADACHPYSAITNPVGRGLGADTPYFNAGVLVFDL